MPPLPVISAVNCRDPDRPCRTKVRCRGDLSLRPVRAEGVNPDSELDEIAADIGCDRHPGGERPPETVTTLDI